MKIEELRVGNYIGFDSMLIPCKVVSIDEDYTYRVKHDYHGTLKNTWANLRPIPLTEEILLKCGFKASRDKGILQASLHKHYFAYSLVSNHLSGNGSNGEIGIRNVLYVHQLQNLYHSLTGEELEIKK